MSIYYAVVEGDPLTSGGNSQVMEGVPHSTIEGPDRRLRSQTLVGQKAWCDACKSVGIIVPAPGSPDTLRERFNFADYQGQEALGGDLVICKCEQHPQVIAVYGRTSMIVDVDSGPGNVIPGSAPAAAAAMTAMTVPATAAYDDRFVLRSANGQALPHTAYAVQRESGSFEYGETDGAGHTHVLAAVAFAETIDIYVGK
ncbi:hypothetical protein LIG30_0463 [Burkholderia sp. lig30]|jgi:hypothetical protein|uniref:PAAR domain-containing protein n=1 Tax=Burkholderia sp. lig30 TaxID=1192124 RepID=UPI0004613EA5|nr:PAAR domain-containing protein [Burkholderia sp. lig30]KDB06189.1 hypothetical protein LIG30_0463 [Burkholderia sp. lig30]